VVPADELSIANGKIVHYGVAEHVLQCTLARNAMAPLADDDPQLGLIVQLAGDPGLERNGVFRADHRRRALEEEFHVLRPLSAAFP
jgi:hypothetical protein